MDNKYFRKFLTTIQDIIDPIMNEMHIFDKTIGFNNETCRDYMRNSSASIAKMYNILESIDLDSVNFTIFVKSIVLEEEREHLILSTFYTVSKLLELPNFTRRDKYEITKYLLKENIKKSNLAITDTKATIEDSLVSIAEETGYLEIYKQNNRVLNLEERIIKEELEKRLKEDNRRSIFKIYMMSSLAYSNFVEEEKNLDELEDTLKKLEFTNNTIDEIKEYINYKLSKKKKEKPKETKITKKEPKKSKITNKDFNKLNSNIKEIYNIDTKEIVKEDITYNDIINVTANLIKMYIDKDEIISFLKKATKRLKLDIKNDYQDFLRNKISYLYHEKLDDFDSYYEELEKDDEWLNIFDSELEKLDKDEYLYEIHEAVKTFSKK